MPSGPPICRLRASGRRTSDSGCGGWPTPVREDGDSHRPSFARREAGRADTLTAAAELAGWPTATVNDSRNGRNRTAGRSNPESAHHDGLTLCDAAALAGWASPRVGNNKGHGNAERGMDGRNCRLEDTAAMAGWATPSTRDHKDTQNLAPRCEGTGAWAERLDQLGRQAQLAGWAKPKVLNYEAAGAIDSGTGSSSSPAGTEKPGVLNPELSRWLMGYPAAWGSCGATAMRSVRGRPRSGSKRSSKPKPS